MLSSTIVVRQYKPSDSGTVEEIEKMSIRELTPLYQLAKYYEIIPECFLVAEVEGKVAGYVVADIHFARDKVREGHVLSIAVHPTYRRNGVGRNLLTQVSNILGAKGAARIRLEVKAHNTSAKGFYLRDGFEEVGVLHGYYRRRGYSEDAVLMIKRLRT